MAISASGRGVLGLALLSAGCAAERETEPAASASTGKRDAALARGREALELARRWTEAGSDPTPPLLDARGAYAEVLALSPHDPAALLEASWTELELGDDGRAHELLRRYVTARAAAPLADPALDALESDVLARVGLEAAAARAARRGLATAPDDVGLHQRLIDRCYAAGELEWLADAYAGLRAASPASATLRWYVGYVELLRGEQARRERHFLAARAAFESARRELAAAGEEQPDYAEMSRRIDHLAALGLAWIARDEGDLATAEHLLVERLEVAADLRDVADGQGRTLMDALLYLGADFERAGDYGGGVRIARAVVTAIPQVEDDSNWWNNLGYFLREQGSQVQSGALPAEDGDGAPLDREAAARDLFRESWEAYLEATRQAPQDARVINDTALIQVYHLRDDLPRAKELLDEAIRIGDEQLARMGPDAPESERFPVAQAVGDAWLNLGYLHYHLEKDWPKARDCFVRSTATNSGPRAENQAYIDSIDGKREPVPLREAGVRAPGGGRDPPPKAQLPWERGLESALAVAAAEHRPLFVYSRGDGLTLGVPFYDQNVTHRPLAEALDGFVCVVADRELHVAAERDSAGRRLLCPRFGAITCAEHRRACDELVARWGALRLEGEGDEPTEGFLVLGPDGKRRTLGGGGGGGRGGSMADALKAVREEAGEPTLGASLAALTSDVLWDEGPAQQAAARRLVRSSSARAREIVEALLGAEDRSRLPLGGEPGHELVVSTAAIRALLDALAEQAGLDDVSLVEALASQREDAVVSALALDRLPASGNAALVERRLQWSEEPLVRSAAERTLRRLDPSEETRARLELLAATEALPR